MFHINIHCKPTPSNEEFFENCVGAHAVILINYKDVDGAFELAKFYVEENDWEIIEVESKYFSYNSKEDLGEFEKFYDEIIKYGYSMIFYTYESEE